MTRALRAVSSADPRDVFEALRDALTGDGPAILPVAGPRAGAEGEAAAVPVAGVGAAAGGVYPEQVPQRIALVVETSGSTSAPKRVALSANALLASASAAETVLGGPGQWLLALPAHYIAGINVLTRSLASQTEPVFAPPGHFDPIAFAEAAERLDADLRFTSLVPAQLARLIEADATLETLRRFDRILVGGQATPEPLMAAAIELGLNVTRTYGSSETGGGCVYDGVPIGDTRVRICDGIIELSGSVLADGYLGDEERTAQAFHEASGTRWYRTHDAGELVTDASGTEFLRVTGRADDVIMSGGVKVSLGAVEQVVRSLPRLGEAVVVAAPDARWGEVPVVVTDREIDTDAFVQVREQVASALGAPARPARVVTVERMPQLDSGKPDRRALKAIAAEPRR